MSDINQPPAQGFHEMFMQGAQAAGDATIAAMDAFMTKFTALLGEGASKATTGISNIGGEIKGKFSDFKSSFTPDATPKIEKDHSPTIVRQPEQTLKSPSVAPNIQAQLSGLNFGTATLDNSYNPDHGFTPSNAVNYAMVQQSKQTLLSAA